MLDTRSTITLEPSVTEHYRIVQQEVDLGVSALGTNDPQMAVTFFQSALQKLSINDPFHDHLVHNLLSSYKLIVEQALAAGDAGTALLNLRAALKLEILGEMAGDEDFRRRFAGAFQDLAVVVMKHRLLDESVVCCRKALSIYSDAGSHVNLTNALLASGQRSTLSDFATDIDRERLGRHIFIACVPKSGSTFLKNVLLQLTGYGDAFMVNSPSQFEQELYLPTLRQTAVSNTVTQQHCKASDVNIFMMQAFEIRPVVLVRNVFDSVISLLDFYDGGASTNSYFREDYQSLDRDTKVDLIIDNFVPWYFQFVASWSLAERQKRLDICWLGYEEMIASKSASVRRVLQFYGLDAPQKGVEKTIEGIESQKGKTRFNKGVAGRGVSGLSEQQKARIIGHARYYPSTDLSCIGL